MKCNRRLCYPVKRATTIVNREPASVYKLVITSTNKVRAGNFQREATHCISVVRHLVAKILSEISMQVITNLSVLQLLLIFACQVRLNHVKMLCRGQHQTLGGLDTHKRKVVCCLNTGPSPSHGPPHGQIRAEILGRVGTSNLSPHLA